MIKKISYAVPMLVALLPIASFIAGQEMGNWIITIGLTPFVLFVAVPILDRLIGRDPSNLSAAASAALSKERYYRLLPMLCLPAYAVTLLFGAWVVGNELMSPLLMLGWIVSVGLVGGIVAITPAHELIHKPNKVEPFLGGTLLAMVSYGTFKIEHVAGHHIDVATPRDGSTAKINQTVFSFVFRSMRRNPGRALELERVNCAQRGRIWRWYTSESVGWAAVSLGFCAVCMLIVGATSMHAPWLGGIYFFGQSFVAVALLEIVNYIEHYGLMRRAHESTDGAVRYERVNHLHSWNADFALTNALLFQLQRHSDHHAFGFRRYQALRHHPDSPQLPAGYPTMVLIALVPPLWFHIMNPLLPPGMIPQNPSR
jgi:alkane 1-monooxygenase